jgi:hypothetical protein
MAFSPRREFFRRLALFSGLAALDSARASQPRVPGPRSLCIPLIGGRGLIPDGPPARPAPRSEPRIPEIGPRGYGPRAADP